MGGGTDSGVIDITHDVRTLSIVFSDNVPYGPFGPDELYIPEELPTTYELNITFDLDSHESVLLYNTLAGPYNWQNESILDRILEELRHPLD